MTTDNDQAAVEALCKIRYEIRGKHAQGSWAQEYAVRPEAARAILDAIRCGEVPTIYHISQIPGVREFAASRAKEKARADKAEKRADEMKADGERAVLDERNKTAMAAAERDRLAGLLLNVRHGPGWVFIDENTKNVISAALAEVGKS